MHLLVAGHDDLRRPRTRVAYEPLSMEVLVAYSRVLFVHSRISSILQGKHDQRLRNMLCSVNETSTLYKRSSHFAPESGCMQHFRMFSPRSPRWGEPGWIMVASRTDGGGRVRLRRFAVNLKRS